MKGQIKLKAIDGWIDKGNGVTTVYLNSGIAINIPTSDFIINYAEHLNNSESYNSEILKIG